MLAALSDPSSWEPKLLEREHEQERLDSLIRDARRGSGSALLIEGPPGVGKSRLLDYARARASRSGMQTLSARASELEREFPYGVVHQLFDRVVSAPDELAISEPNVGAAARVLFGTLSGLHRFTVDVSNAAPLLLTVDDAHWADLPSLEFVMFLSLRLAALPILLVLAARPHAGDEQGPLTRLGADPSIECLTPGPLGPHSAAELLSAALGSPADAPFSSVCQELTGGNPFLLTELARSLAADGVRPTTENVSVLRELVPDAINRAALIRLGRLPASARDLAYAVAILGDGCDLRHAAALASMESGAAADAADALRKADILAGEPLLRFVHPLVRTAIHEQVPSGARSRRHQRAAALLADDGAPPERVAIHLLATEPADDPRVVETLYDAARRAHDQGAAAPALAYLVRALREPARGETRRGILELLVPTGLRAGALPVIDRMRAELLAELGSDDETLRRCGEDLAIYLYAAGRGDDGQAIAERAIHAADRAGDLGLVVALECHLAFYRQLPPAAARKRLRRYHGRLAEDSGEQRLALALEAFWSGLLGDPAADVAALARRALSGGRIFAEQRQLAPAGQAILVLARADDLDAAGRAAEEMIAAAGARGSVAGLGSAWHLRGFVKYCRGELRSAEEDLRQAVDAARIYGITLASPVWNMLLIGTLVERDELELAERELTASGMTGTVPDGYWLRWVLFTRGRLRLAQMRFREAAEDLLELRDRLRRWQTDGNPLCPAATYAARAMSALGEREAARELAEEGLRDARRWGAGSVIAEALVSLGIVTGGERGLLLLRQAVEHAQTTPARLVHAATLTELGSLLRRERQPAAAREPLRAGLDLARRCGAVALARRAAGELEATGVKVERYTPIGADSLTPSEHRVAELAMQGMTNREIAATLYVTIKTVESHLRSAYDKLGIGSRQELADALRTPEQQSAVAPVT
jgi:DNA-binding CsgD family transcriptional regulator